MKQHAAIDILDQVQGHIAWRIERIHDVGYEPGTDPVRAVIAELNGLIGDIQDVKAEGARELRRMGFKVPLVKSRDALILEAEQRDSGHERRPV